LRICSSNFETNKIILWLQDELKFETRKKNSEILSFFLPTLKVQLHIHKVLTLYNQQ
jgi:hypothetical protein